MSNMNEQGFTPGLDLGPAPWVPTQPASEYVGPMPGAVTPQQPVAPQVPPYGQAQDYQNYSPQPEQTYSPELPYPAAPPYMQAQIFPPMQPYVNVPPAAGYAGAPLVPGQVVQTPYGAFVVGPKSKLAAGLLGIILGGFGAGQFYRGNIGMGIAQLAVTFVTVGAGWIWGLIDGIMVLVAQPGSPSSLDSNRQIMV